MNNYHIPKRQNWNGNKYLQFKRFEEKLVSSIEKKHNNVPLPRTNSIGRVWSFGNKSY